MTSWLLGLGGSDHDFSAALSRGCDIRVAIEQERLSRRKHGTCFWYESPIQRAIDYCLDAEAIRLSEIELIATTDTLPAGARDHLRCHTVREFSHHLCHAASAYIMLPPGAVAGVIVYDGFGSPCGDSGDRLRTIRETFSFFIFDSHGWKRIGRTVGLGYAEPDDFPTGVTNSVGMLYEAVTGLIGYEPSDAGKTMGLAAHGRPDYLPDLEEFVSYGESPASCFCCSTGQDFVRTVERILSEGGGGFTIKADLAASVQAIVNKALINCERFFDGFEIDHLCISGGCGLNTVANSFLQTHSKRGLPITIPPHCGDSGLGFGALWLALLERGGRAPELTFRGGLINPGLARPGRSYAPAEHRASVQQFYPRLVLDPAVNSGTSLAGVITKGLVVGVLNGRSEIGPRALGGRSIIADPRNVMTRERINRAIKLREPFRPLAPLVLSSRFDRYFQDRQFADPFMLKVAYASDRCRREAPAVIHEDGTARVQEVPDGGDPFLVELLTAFEELTGVGILINTSFNRRGEPMVESPLDAVDAFLGMGLDGLYLDGLFYLPATSMNRSS
jgi:carbamoyltransferase